jgi:hypothetical protein
MRGAFLLPLAALAAGATACWGGSESADTAATKAAAGEPRGAGSRTATVAADSLANTRIGGPYGTVLALRFRSGWTGEVRAVRVYVIRNTDGRTGYSGGTGGTMRIALAPDSGGRRHVPARRSLAAATLDPASGDAWPLVRFREPARVVAGRLYHVVFTNVDPDPRRNYVSINALVSHRQQMRTPGVPGGFAVLLSDSRDGGRTPGAWQSRSQRRGDRYTPILDVVGGSDGQHVGVGYMEVWVNNPKPIGGDAKVRQLLAPVAGRAISGAWLRVRRRGDANAPLELRIERDDGSVLGAEKVQARKVRRHAPGWVHVRFGRPVTLGDAGQLALVATTSAAGAYEAFAVRKGTEFGFHPHTVFDGGYAQFTQDGRWVGWDQWGGSDLRTGDLQFALDTIPP